MPEREEYARTCGTDHLGFRARADWRSDCILKTCRGAGAGVGDAQFDLGKQEREHEGQCPDGHGHQEHDFQARRSELAPPAGAGKSE